MYSMINIKNILQGMNGTFEEVDEWISAWEDRVMKATKLNRRQTELSNMTSVISHRDPRRRRENRTENLFEEITTENFQNLRQ